MLFVSLFLIIIFLILVNFYNINKCLQIRTFFADLTWINSVSEDEVKNILIFSGLNY